MNKQSHKAMKINNTTKRLSCLGLAHNTHTSQTQHGEHNIYDTASHSFEMINNNHNNNDYKNDNVVCCVLYVSALFFWKVKWDRRTRRCSSCVFMWIKVSHKHHQQKCIYVNCNGTICIHSGFLWNGFYTTFTHISRNHQIIGFVSTEERIVNHGMCTI